MHIKQELQDWLVQNIPEKQKEKHRNICIILSYYGFGDSPWPTLEEIAKQFSVGSRERVRQIINDTFKNHANPVQFPIANLIFDDIEQHDIVSIPKLRSKLIDRELASADTTIRGVLNLAKDLHRCNAYDLYDSSLNKVARSEAEFDSNTFLVNSDVLSELKSGLKKAHTLPGLLGLSQIEYLHREIGDTEIAEKVTAFVNESPEAIKVNAGGARWYIYENRDNTLINCCEKIFGLTDRLVLDIDVLSYTLQNALRRRSHAFDYPQVEVISEWIEFSRWFRVNEKAVEFLGEKRDLTEIELAIVDYLSSIEYSLYPPLKEHLLAMGYSKPATDKAITTSPLVTVDKSGHRKTYKYTLISKAGAVSDYSPQKSNKYQDFKNRLKTLFVTGTDAHAESFFRREQSILREWLFGDNAESHCAICGGLFSVSALVTAHKKKRSMCSESERVDPYIVFPLCVFGCDYLYESGALKIHEGKVMIGKTRESNTQDIMRVRELLGKELHKDWLRGDLAYFERSLT